MLAVASRYFSQTTFIISNFSHPNADGRVPCHVARDDGGTRLHQPARIRPDMGPDQVRLPGRREKDLGVPQQGQRPGRRPDPIHVVHSQPRNTAKTHGNAGKGEYLVVIIAGDVVYSFYIVSHWHPQYEARGCLGWVPPSSVVVVITHKPLLHSQHEIETSGLCLSRNLWRMWKWYFYYLNK